MMDRVSCTLMFPPAGRFQEAILMFLVCFYFSSLESRNTWWEGGHFLVCAFPGHGEQVKQVLQISISLCEILYKLCCL